jgi:uncharacterized protein (DUF1499 family)
MQYSRPTTHAPLPLIVVLPALLTALALVLVLLAGLGTRWGWWHFRTGFTLLRWGVILGGAFAVLTIIAGALTAKLSRGRSLIVAGATAVVAGGVLWGPVSMARTARRVPAIHDITTDTEDPPSFMDVLPRRTGATNAPTYGGDSVARLQREAYPDVRPITLSVPPAQALVRAEEVARDMGWEIVTVDRDAGRLEATDRTRWFGFYDDIVVRVRPEGAGSRVDVRSLSRVGRSDVGMNAKRIREYSKRLGTRD